jgi:amidase
MYRRWQSFFDHHDVILSPAMTISPRPWTELYPAEIDGKPTRTYFNWLALSYCSSLIGHPSLCLPMGLDRHGMPFGLQIVGPRGGDALVFAIAAALETHLADSPVTARPIPDLARLHAAPPIADMPGFMSLG